MSSDNVTVPLAYRCTRAKNEMNARGELIVTVESKQAGTKCGHVGDGSASYTDRDVVSTHYRYLEADLSALPSEAV